MREAGAPLAETSRQIAEATRRISQSAGQTEQTVVTAQAEIRNTVQLLQIALNATAQQWQDYERRFSGLDENLEKVLDKIIESVRANLDALGVFVEKIDGKLAGAVDRLGGGIQELGEFLEPITTRLNGGSRTHGVVGSIEH
jgi:hypothetical protein